MADQRSPLSPPRHFVDQSPQRMRVADRLVERILVVGHPVAFFLALDAPVAREPDRAALRLDADEAVVRMAHDEVDLAVPRALLATSDRPAGGVEGVPRVVQLIPERVVDL